MLGHSNNLPQSQQSKVTPFSLSDKEILAYIIARHNPKAKIQDVDHLYNKVSNIVKGVSSKHIIDKRLELKYGESKVFNDSNFVPTFHTLKDISSQMTNKCLDAYNLHETIMLILEKLHEYNWATKGVIVLATFALNYGEPWHVSKMVPTKANSLEIHISSGENLKRPTEAIIDYNTNDYNTLVDPAMQLIKVVINMEKLIAKNDELKGTAKDELYKVPRDIYTYWAIFALLACSSQMTMDLKSELAQRIGTILNGFASKWKSHIDEVEDYLWRLNVFRSPSGVSQLLKALIFPRDIPYLEIYDNTTKSLVSPHQLNTNHFLLYISTVYINEDFIKNNLHPIHKSFMMDPKKSNYRILCVPIVEYVWDEETKKERFNELKSMMPWYIVESFQPIKGLRVLDEMWEYPSVVVVDPQGNVLHPNASEMIIRWDDATAFPFTSEREKQLLQQYGWFWNLLQQVHRYIGGWLIFRNYIFVYGGNDKARVKEFGELVERIKKDMNLYSNGDVEIEHLNLGEKLEISEEEFWGKVIAEFQERIMNKRDGDENVLSEMEMLLAMKNEKVWALFSKGHQVMVVDYDLVIYDTLEGFKNWQVDILKHGFDKAFINYYHLKRSQEIERHCYYFQLENLAFAPHNLICPEPDCRLKMKMEIKSIKYTCCHEKLNQRLRGTPNEKSDKATPHS